MVAIDLLVNWRRKRAVVVLVQDNKATTCIFRKERRLPRRSVVIRVFEDKAKIELVGYIRNKE